MRLLWLVMLGGSFVTLLWLLWRQPRARVALKGCAVHLVLAAVGLYMLNGLQLVPGLSIPLNPMTMGIVALLGLPGVGLLLGLQAMGIYS